MSSWLACRDGLNSPQKYASARSDEIFTPSDLVKLSSNDGTDAMSPALIIGNEADRQPHFEKIKTC
jgi:hypothetical protein